MDRANYHTVLKFWADHVTPGEEDVVVVEDKHGVMTLAPRDAFRQYLTEELKIDQQPEGVRFLQDFAEPLAVEKGNFSAFYYIIMLPRGCSLKRIQVQADRAPSRLTN